MRTLIMPDHAAVVPGYVAGETIVSDDQDRAYNQHCTELIIKALLEQQEAGEAVPLVKTHYPFDLPDGTSDDTVSLGEDGEVIIIDGGVQ